MRRIILIMLLIAAFCSPARAEELHLLGGWMWDIGTNERSYSWQLEYMEGLNEHTAFSLSYLNEGHVPIHHRDGNAFQFWARTNLLDRRLSLAAGAGPYYYFDTTEAKAGASFSNDHGWGGMFSLAATWYTESRWLFQLRTNWVETGSSIDTMSTVFGIGYQLTPPPAPGPLAKAPLRQDKTTNNEITVFIGRTIVNSFDSEHSLATAIEYRRGLWRYVDWTAGWLYEGDNRLIRRQGLITQLWAVKAFLDDRLALGVGGGGYMLIERWHELLQGDNQRFFSGIVTMTGSYRLQPHWDIRTSWNRIVTNYDRDADVILAGIGYRF